ncbi:hypothetical protein SHELI_v1c08430 [Spiroplasma helicoides]|uniref:Acyltransferase 3 domain-containing protein n=1 Tax=Spiroplasma helicoides TaxID=216938 RepID=A0A1B3SLI7_9MOLU|nr:acyltransferase family protein [Spiroplasma helicoides]AOG60792.1 hypothetical protein SHELI_v1c08430 [Spiroplasma helicoides]
MKNTNIEILRIIMSFFVILLHQAGPFDNYSYNDIWYFKYFCPWVTGAKIFFILITGYFKVNTKNYNNGVFVINISISWLLNFGFACLVYSFTRDAIPFKSLLLGGRDWWYIWALLVIQIIMPVLNKIINNFNKYYLLLCIVILYLLLEFTSNYLYGQIFGITNLFAMILLYCIGGMIRNHVELYFKYQYLIIFLNVILLWVAIDAINMFTKYDFVYKQLGVPNALFSVEVFIIVTSFRRTKNEFINYLGSSMLYVYLYHYLIQELNSKYIYSKILDNLNLQLQVNILALITLFATLVVALLITKPIDYLSKFIARKTKIDKVTFSIYQK